MCQDSLACTPIWPIIEFSMGPTGNAKDDRMNSFIKCVAALFGKILYINDTARIATILIIGEDSDYIRTKAGLPSNFTKLGQYVMISGGSWVFNKKAKGSNDVYARFRLKSQVDTEKIVNRVSFEFSCLGGQKPPQEAASGNGDQNALHAALRMQRHRPGKHHI